MSTPGDDTLHGAYLAADAVEGPQLPAYATEYFGLAEAGLGEAVASGSTRAAAVAAPDSAGAAFGDPPGCRGTRVLLAGLGVLVPDVSWGISG